MRIDCRRPLTAPPLLDGQHVPALGILDDEGLAVGQDLVSHVVQHVALVVVDLWRVSGPSIASQRVLLRSWTENILPLTLSSVIWVLVSTMLKSSWCQLAM